MKIYKFIDKIARYPIENKYLSIYWANSNYSLNCDISIFYSLYIFHSLNRILAIDNLNYPDQFRPFSNLKFKKNTIYKTLFFIEDSIEFSKKSLILYNNTKLKNEIKTAKLIIDKLYINIEKNQLKIDQINNWKATIELKKKEFIQLDFKNRNRLIYWRTEKEWEYCFNKKSTKYININIKKENNLFEV